MKDEKPDLSTTCRTCLKVANAHSGIMPGNTPDDGDVALCHNCGTVSIFVRAALGFVLREPTPAEMAEIDADETIREARRLQAIGGRPHALIRAWRNNAPREGSE